MAGAISGFADNSHCSESRGEGSVDPWDALSKSASSCGSCNGRRIPYTAEEYQTGVRLTRFACHPVGYQLENHHHWRADESIVQDDLAILGVIRTETRTLWCFDGVGVAVNCLIISTRPALRPTIHRKTGLISFSQEHFLAWRGCNVWQYVTKSYPLN